MNLRISLLFAFFSLTQTVCGDPQEVLHTCPNFQDTCIRIAKAVSSLSHVFFPPSHEYLSDNSHYALSSSEVSACSVEPHSAEDLSKILRILGSTRTPFAVKSGGHALNPGFSSTKGVQIAMTRFNGVKINSRDGTVEIGSGLTWGEVYAALNSTGVNVVGGRLPTVGVAGLTLGGGYSFKSSQYGLTVDTMAGFELVLPNGTIRTVTPNDTDLWFGLRGGLNNFGIVTKFVFKSHPQSEVWGATLLYDPIRSGAALRDAIVKFQENQNTKAAILAGYLYSSGQVVMQVIVFYDAPAPPGGIFDDFLAIPTIKKNIISGSFYDFVQSMEAPPSGVRTFASSVSVTHYSPAVIDASLKQTTYWGQRLMALDNNSAIFMALEPFDKGLLSHGFGSAYPPDRSQVFPSLIQYVWSDASLDNTMARMLRQHTDEMRAAVIADGQDVSHAAVFVNNALFDTPLEDIYGANLPRLREVRAAFDPDDVMGLTGGFKFN